MSERSHGFEEYTPSSLEWLVVLLNSYVHFFSDVGGISESRLLTVVFTQYPHPISKYINFSP